MHKKGMTMLANVIIIIAPLVRLELTTHWLTAS
jgi:hypothetical protein